jgi:hypothetical protein
MHHLMALATVVIYKARLYNSLRVQKGAIRLRRQDAAFLWRQYHVVLIVWVYYHCLSWFHTPNESFVSLLSLTCSAQEFGNKLEFISGMMM